MKFRLNLCIRLGVVFLTIIFVLSFSTIFIYKTDIEKMQEQLLEYDKAVVKNFANSLDETVNELHKAFYSIYSLDYEAFNKVTGEIDFYAAKQVIENIFYTKQYSERIYDIVIYSNDNPEFFITTNGSYSYLNVFEYLFNNPMYSTTFWKNYHADQDIVIFPSSLYTNLIVNENGISRNLIAVVSSRPDLKKYFNTIIFIDVEKIFGIKAQKEYLEKSGFAVFNTNKTILMSKNLKNNELISLKNQINYHTSLEGTFEMNNKYYFIRTLFDFILVNRISDGSILSTTKTLNILVMVLSVITCFAISLISVLLFYKPVKNILMSISKKDTSNQNEFKIIDSEIKSLINQTASLTQTVHTLKDINIRNTFHKIINGIEITDEDLANMFSAIIKSNDNITLYVVATADLIPKTKASRSCDSEDYSRNLSMDFKVLWQKYLPYSIIYEFQSRRFTSLVLLNANITKKMLETTLDNFIKEFMKDFVDDTLCLAISSIHSNILDIKKAHEESITCIRFKSISSQNAVMYYNEIFEPKNHYLPFELLEKLKSKLMVGDSKECLAIIDEIVTRNIDLKLDHFTFNNLCYHILKTLYQVIPESISGTLNKSYNFINSATELFSFNNVADYRSFFKNHVIAFTKIIRQETGKHIMLSQEKINYIMEYMMLHYNEDLYLDNLSAIVSLSPKYFSRHFKEVTGFNYIEYLNKIRVSRAKDLLKNPDLTFNEIALMVGYKSNSALTANFIKYLGMPPVKYRTMITD